jgi:hypothetical protein
MKACFRCSEVKPLSEFYTNPRLADGHLGKCKECARRDVRENREKRRDYYLEYDRNRPNAAERAQSSAERRKTEQGKLQHKKAVDKCREKYPLKHAARVITSQAIRDGRLLKSPCEVCGEVKSVHAHHEDYMKPLDVNWLCPRHHADRHKVIKRSPLSSGAFSPGR